MLDGVTFPVKTQTGSLCMLMDLSLSVDAQDSSIRECICTVKTGVPSMPVPGDF